MSESFFVYIVSTILYYFFAEMSTIKCILIHAKFFGIAGVEISFM